MEKRDIILLALVASIASAFLSLLDIWFLARQGFGFPFPFITWDNGTYAFNVTHMISDFLAWTGFIFIIDTLFEAVEEK